MCASYYLRVTKALHIHLLGIITVLQTLELLGFTVNITFILFSESVGYFLF